MIDDNDLSVRALFDRTSCTYTYLLACRETREAVLVDPVFAHHQRDMALIRELELRLVMVLDTHVHADHITGAWLARACTDAPIALAEAAGGSEVDRPLNDGDEITFGTQSLVVRATPGHTAGCLSFVDKRQRFVMTGDALMIRGTGRTDFQGGSARTLFDSITQQLFALPDTCLVLPGHDYLGRTVSTIGEERHFNPRVGGGASATDFVGHLDNLALPHPKHIDAAVPANLMSGKPSDGQYPSIGDWAPLELTFAGIPEIEASWVAAHRARVCVVDVREREELKGELGALDDILHIPLDEFRDKASTVPDSLPVVIVCRSGRRSGLAVKILRDAGKTQVANLRGGMLAWRKQIN